MEEVDIEGQGEGAAGAGVATAKTQPPVLPDWISEPEYEDIISDEKNKGILSRYKDIMSSKSSIPPSVLKALVEREKMISSGFRLPENLSPVEVAELRKAISKINAVPDNAEKYGLKKPGEIDEDLDFSENTKMELRAFAKENDFSPKTLQGFYEKALQWMQKAKGDAVKQRTEYLEKTKNTTIELMQTYWGPNEYEDRLPIIDSFAESRAIDDKEYEELDALLEQTGLKYNPLLFKLLGDGAKAISILEGNGKLLPGSFGAKAANAVITEKQRLAKRYPKTPASLGGGAPG